MANLESLFEQWLEGNILSDAQLQQLENDPEYSALMSKAQVWQQHSREYKAVPVPDWDRQSTMPQVASVSVFSTAGIWAVAASVMICSLIFLVMPKQQAPELLEQVAKQTQLLESQQKQIDQLQKLLRRKMNYSSNTCINSLKRLLPLGALNAKKTLIAYLRISKPSELKIRRICGCS